jgi:hypothetical protein
MPTDLPSERRPEVSGEQLTQHLRQIVYLDEGRPRPLKDVFAAQDALAGATISAAAVVEFMHKAVRDSGGLAPRGLALEGAEIRGDLNLSGLDWPRGVSLTHCHFTGELRAGGTRLGD